MIVEEQYQDVLQNIEFAVATMYRRHPELTDYAVTLRYPGEYEPVGKDELERAIRIATAVFAWAVSVVRP